MRRAVETAVGRRRSNRLPIERLLDKVDLASKQAGTQAGRHAVTQAGGQLCRQAGTQAKITTGLAMLLSAGLTSSSRASTCQPPAAMCVSTLEDPACLRFPARFHSEK
jgi:hypothetical protein